MFSKVFTVSLLFGAAFARILQIQNIASVPLVVSITGQSDVNVLASSTALVTVEENFLGDISAVASSSETIDVPRTRVELTLSSTGDSYAVSLIEGFNLKAKIVPIQGTNCTASVCAADLISKCPVEDQVSNSLGTIVACRHSPVLFKRICPKAVVSSEDAANILTCQALSYRIFLG